MSAKPVHEKIVNAIVRAVRGEKSPWPVNPDHPVEGTFEERLKGGDQQALLWAIDECGEKGEPIPTWAFEALRDVMIRASIGEFRSWDDAFGKIMSEGAYRSRVAGLARHAVAVGERIRELRKTQPIDDAMWEKLHREFDIGVSRLKEYWDFSKKL